MVVVDVSPGRIVAIINLSVGEDFLPACQVLHKSVRCLEASQQHQSEHQIAFPPGRIEGVGSEREGAHVCQELDEVQQGIMRVDTQGCPHPLARRKIHQFGIQSPHGRETCHQPGRQRHDLEQRQKREQSRPNGQT